MPGLPSLLNNPYEKLCFPVPISLSTSFVIMICFQISTAGFFVLRTASSVNYQPTEIITFWCHSLSGPMKFHFIFFIEFNYI